MDEPRRFVLDPFLESGARVELGHLDAVNGRAFVPQLPYVLFAHLPDPKHPMPLQAGMGEIDSTVIKRPSVPDLAERIKTLKAAHSIEATPQRVRQKHSSAEEPVTAHI